MLTSSRAHGAALQLMVGGMPGQLRQRTLRWLLLAWSFRPIPLRLPGTAPPEHALRCVQEGLGWHAAHFEVV
jgi:hypothetical protein